MKEAKLILDVVDGFLRSGKTLNEAGQLLCRVFGGWTAQPSSGCWHHNGELVIDDSITISVAINEIADWPAFRDIALQLAEGQETVYLVSPSGQVFILVVANERSENIAQLLQESEQLYGAVHPTLG